MAQPHGRDATHDVEWQPTRDFVDENEKFSAAIKGYTKEYDLLPNVLNKAE